MSTSDSAVITYFFVIIRNTIVTSVCGCRCRIRLMKKVDMIPKLPGHISFFWKKAKKPWCLLLSHLPLTENRLNFFDRTNLTNNYESTYIWWYEIIKIILFCQTLFEKTHISVILYYKIDHFCPLKSNFHPFPAIWPNVWVWNSLLTCCYHLLVQIRHARSLSFPFWHQ